MRSITSYDVETRARTYRLEKGRPPSVYGMPQVPSQVPQRLYHQPDCGRDRAASSERAKAKAAVVHRLAMDHAERHVRTSDIGQRAVGRK